VEGRRLAVVLWLRISSEGEQAGRCGRKLSCTPQRMLVLSMIQNKKNNDQIGNTGRRGKHKKQHLWWHKNSSCDATFIALCVQSIAPITIGKPALAANCASMLACSTALREFDIPAEMQIIPSHSAGMARLRVDWHSPNWLASVLRSNAGHSSAHSSRRIALGNLKRG